MFTSKNEATQPCMFWKIAMIFSVKVFCLNEFQTCFRVKVDVTRRYDDENQVIWYWPEARENELREQIPVPHDNFFKSI